MPEDTQLIIEQGTNVIFTRFCKIDVHGSIKAIGTFENPITFRSSSPELFSFDDSEAGSWNGIVFENTICENDTSKFQYCIFQNSKSVDDFDLFESSGGVFRIKGYSDIVIENSIFTRNFGFRGSAIGCYYGASPTIVSCLFFDNEAVYDGGAIANTYSFPRLYHNTFYNNRVQNDDPFVDTAVITNFKSKPVVYCNIVSDDETDSFKFVKPYYTIGNISNNYEGGNFNLIADPQFIDPASNNFLIEETSPAVDKFDIRTLGLFLPEKDLAGNQRIYGKCADSGAFENLDIVKIDDNSVKYNGLLTYPNPFNPETNINFNLDKSSNAKLAIYNVRGELVKLIFEGYLSKGIHQFIWKPQNNISSGVFFSILEIEGEKKITKMVYNK